MSCCRRDDDEVGEKSVRHASVCRSVGCACVGGVVRSVFVRVRNSVHPSVGVSLVSPVCVFEITDGRSVGWMDGLSGCPSYSVRFHLLHV
jgi:hypothetical protein